MADETILVVDADHETDQRITSTLEAEGYLVFSGVSHVVTDDMAGKLNPSLIYIKPLSANAAGFQPCRTIHSIAKLQRVPIVLLAALKGKVEPQFTEYYGIVDFLKPNFTPEELIAKTVSVLASAQRPAKPEEIVSMPIEIEEADAFEASAAAEKPNILTEPAANEEPPALKKPVFLGEPPAELEPPAAEEFITRNEAPAEQEPPLKKAAAPARVEEDEFPWEDEAPKPALSKQSLPKQHYRRGRAQQPSLLPWLIGLLVLVILGGGGFVAYQYSIPLEKPAAPEVKKVAPPTTPEQKGAENAPLAPPVTASPATAPAPDSAPAAVPAPVTPTKTPAPAVSQPAAAPKKPVYAVQAGAFKTEGIANELVKKLKGKGYEAFAQKGVTRDNAPIIRVLIGSFSDRKAAVKLAGEIQAKEQIKTTIFTN